MTNKELINYFSRFAPDDTVGMLALDLETRTAYKPDGYQLMTDAGFPVLLFELGEGEPLDGVVEEAEG